MIVIELKNQPSSILCILMNKGELVNAIQDYLNRTISKKDIGLVVDGLIHTVQSQVSQGEKVAITGFGAFEKRERKERKGHNPRTGEATAIPAKAVPVFAAGKTFKELVNDSHTST